MGKSCSIKLKWLLLASLFLGLSDPAQAAMGDLGPSSVLTLPPVSFQSVDSKEKVSLESFRGKVVLLNFWATWCAPCVAEMPALDKLQAAYGAQGFVIVPVSQDTTGGITIRSFYRQRKLSHLGGYWDRGGAAFHSLGLSGLPTSYLIGRDGKVIGEAVGECDWLSAKTRALIEKALTEAKPASAAEET